MNGRPGKRFLALDPGGTTGWSLWFLPDDGPLELIEYGMIPGGLAGFKRWWRERTAWSIEWDFIVSESFVLDGRTPKPDITPLRIEGAIEMVYDGEFVLQRNTYKMHAPDDLLKQLGYYWRGPGHDRDSARHAIAYAITQRHMPTIMHLYPPPVG